MADSGIKLKYRTGSVIQQCTLYTSSSDIINSNDVAVPILIDNETYYLIAVDPSNFSDYKISAVETIINDITYRIAVSKTKCRLLDFVYYGPKNMPIATAATNIFSKLDNYIKTTGHADYIKLNNIPTGVEVSFQNVEEAFVTYYDLVGAGGNGGCGGLAKSVQSGTSGAFLYGAGGGGGEAGERIENTNEVKITKAIIEYSDPLGEVSLKTWNGDTAVINSIATYGSDGGNANYDIAGLGGKGRTNGTDGTDGSKLSENSSVQYNSNAVVTNISKGGAGGAGGVIWEVMHGIGGAGGVGSENTLIKNIGGTGSGWYLRVRFKYRIVI